MVFLPFRAVVGIGIQKIESLGVKLEEMKIWSLFATVLTLFATVLSWATVLSELLQWQTTRFVPKRLEFVSNGYIGF